MDRPAGLICFCPLLHRRPVRQKEMHPGPVSIRNRIDPLQTIAVDNGLHLIKVVEEVGGVALAGGQVDIKDHTGNHVIQQHSLA